MQRRPRKSRPQGKHHETKRKNVLNSGRAEGSRGRLRTGGRGAQSFGSRCQLHVRCQAPQQVTNRLLLSQTDLKTKRQTEAKRTKTWTVCRNQGYTFNTLRPWLCKLCFSNLQSLHGGLSLSKSFNFSWTWTWSRGRSSTHRVRQQIGKADEVYNFQISTLLSTRHTRGYSGYHSNGKQLNGVKTKKPTVIKPKQCWKALQNHWLSRQFLEETPVGGALVTGGVISEGGGATTSLGPGSSPSLEPGSSWPLGPAASSLLPSSDSPSSYSSGSPWMTDAWVGRLPKCKLTHHGCGFETEWFVVRGPNPTKNIYIYIYIICAYPDAGISANSPKHFLKTKMDERTPRYQRHHNPRHFIDPRSVKCSAKTPHPTITKDIQG